MMMSESIGSQPVFSPLAAAPDRLWPLVLADLRQQMTKATFNTWLVDCCILIAPSTPTFRVVVVRNEFAHEWLTNRLAPVIEHTLVGLVGSKVVVCLFPKLCEVDAGTLVDGKNLTEVQTYRQFLAEKQSAPASKTALLDFYRQRAQMVAG